MKKLILLSLCVAMLASCGQKGNEEKLKQENDALTLALDQRNAELDEIMSTFNSIQEGFRQINEAENRVDLDRDGISENSLTAKQRITADMQFIAKTMEENRQQLAKLQEQLRKSNTNSSQLKKAVDALTAELAEKTQRIEELRLELESKNVRIQELDETVSNLTANVDELRNANEEKERVVSEQEKALNTAWFVFGTKSELKAQKILQSGDVLQSADFNKDYFTEVDIRKMKEIKLYSKRAELLTSHPANSYSLEKDDKNQLTLVINNPKDFWSVSRYLVIQVR